VPEYLERARDIGGDLVIASLTDEDDAHHILEAAAISCYFSHVLTEKSVARRKPYPDVYLLAARLLATTPQQMLVHEDSPVGVASGKAAGSRVAAFPVYDNLVFDPPPDAIFASWVGLDSRDVARVARQGQA